MFILDLIDKRDISVLFPVLEELGGWPVLGNSTGGRLTFDDYSLNELLGRLMRYYNSPLISMYVYQDYKQSNRNIIYVSIQKTCNIISKYFFCSNALFRGEPLIAEKTLNKHFLKTQI